MIYASKRDFEPPARDVRRQFLTEAVVISVAGGSLGIVGGVLLAKALTSVLGWPTDVGGTMALIAFLCAALTGVFFGWYPARRAAGTDPIDGSATTDVVGAGRARSEALLK